MRMDRDQLKARARRLIATANELLALAHDLEFHGDEDRKSVV